MEVPITIDPERQRLLAQRLRTLHDGPRPLLLINAWDVASARVFARAGADAIATTSAGVSAALGYRDGQRIDPQQMTGVVARIATAVDLPVSADLEAGYGDEPQAAANSARLALAAGAVGLNLEDTTDSPKGALLDIERQIEKIVAIREVGEWAGVPIVINARTDVFLAAVGEPEDRVRLATARANAYRAAGADCLFVPGVRDAETIAELVASIDGPLNILAGPGSPSVKELHRLGVARISVGSGPMRAALAFIDRLAHELLEHGTYTALDNSITYPQLLELFDEGESH